MVLHLLIEVVLWVGGYFAFIAFTIERKSVGEHRRVAAGLRGRRGAGRVTQAAAGWAGRVARGTAASDRCAAAMRRGGRCGELEGRWRRTDARVAALERAGWLDAWRLDGKYAHIQNL